MAVDGERVRRLEIASSIEWEIGERNYDAPGLAKDEDLRAGAAQSVLEDLESRDPTLKEWVDKAHAATVAAAALEVAKEVKAPRVAVNALTERAAKLKEELDRLSLPLADNAQGLISAYAALLRVSVGPTSAEGTGSETVKQAD